MERHLNSRKRSRRKPYYTLRHGQNILRVLDALYKNPDQPQKISASGIAPETVRSQFYQACEYVVDHLDPEKKYVKLLEQITTHKERGYIIVRRKGGELVVSASLVNYRMNLEAFIEVASPGDKFPVEQPVLMSDEEVMEVLGVLSGLEELFLYRVSRTELEVIRI